MSLERAVAVSNRGFNFLMIFANHGPDYVMDEDSLREIDMRTAGSLAMRRDPLVIRTTTANGRRGLRLSPYGWDVVRAYKDTNILRKNPTLDLSKWLGTYLRSGRDERERRAGRRVRRATG